MLLVLEIAGGIVLGVMALVVLSTIIDRHRYWRDLDRASKQWRDSPEGKEDAAIAAALKLWEASTKDEKARLDWGERHRAATEWRHRTGDWSSYQ
jgi:hypothetical protein